jgi:FtsP/CotA-like multicopper oxidase with cupredoxin domain
MATTGKSSPVTEPLVAKLGQKIRIRFMNEGTMIHPMHLHGNCTNPGTWAFHCHILPHAESQNGMFGMVTALVVQK